MGGLTRGGTVETVSRTKLSGADSKKKKKNPAKLTTSRIGNLTRLIHTLLNVLTIHEFFSIYFVYI